uniref:BHLH domain-containing protein n=1 Tax=Steinernema glaseri TaxID=37863 RepID=A0A1I8AHA1_9BILA
MSEEKKIGRPRKKTTNASTMRARNKTMKDRECLRDYEPCAENMRILDFREKLEKFNVHQKHEVLCEYLTELQAMLEWNSGMNGLKHEEKMMFLKKIDTEFQNLRGKMRSAGYIPGNGGSPKMRNPDDKALKRRITSTKNAIQSAIVKGYKMIYFEICGEMLTDAVSSNQEFRCKCEILKDCHVKIAQLDKSQMGKQHSLKHKRSTLDSVIKTLNTLRPDNPSESLSEKSVMKAHIKYAKIHFYDVLKSIVNVHWSDLSDAERSSFSFVRDPYQTIPEAEETASALEAQRKEVALERKAAADSTAQNKKLRTELLALQREVATAGEEGHQTPREIFPTEQIYRNENSYEISFDIDALDDYELPNVDSLEESCDIEELESTVHSMDTHHHGGNLHGYELLDAQQQENVNNYSAYPTMDSNVLLPNYDQYNGPPQEWQQADNLYANNSAHPEG